MALSKVKKHAVVDEVAQLLSSSKMTIVATYKGTPVKALQLLRKQAKENGTSVQVVKNRLAIKALQQNDTFKNVDTSALTGMLLYAFNSNDEVASAQVLAKFAKTQPTLEFVGGITAEGAFIGADDVKALALLPGKEQLIAQVLATLMSPVHDVTNSLSGNLHALLDGVEAKATN